MKKLFTLLFCVFTMSLFAQITIPSKSEYGLIITQTKEKIYYKNLSYEKGKLSFYNIQTEKQEFLYDASVLEIKENVSMSVSPNNNETDSPKIKKLTSDEEIKNYLLQSNNAKYLSGKSTNSTGTAFVIGGATCFVVGGLLNLSKANDANQDPNNYKKGSSVPLIIGLAGIGVGIILKISGHSVMREAVQNYKTASIFSKENLQNNLFIVADNKGFGLRLKF